MIKRSQQERLWMVGAGLVAFVVAAIGYFFFIGPQRSDTDDVRSRTADAQLQNAALQHDIAVLAADNKNLPIYQNALKQAHLALPAASGLPEFLRTLQTLGTATSTNVTGLSVGAPAALRSTAASPAPTGSTTAAPTAAPSSGASAAAGGVYALPITAELTGTTAHLRSFLTQLQSVQPRAVLISSVVEGGAATTGTSKAAGAATTTLQLTMQAFVEPSLDPVATPSVSPAPSASTP